MCLFCWVVRGAGVCVWFAVLVCVCFLFLLRLCLLLLLLLYVFAVVDLCVVAVVGCGCFVGLGVLFVLHVVVVCLWALFHVVVSLGCVCVYAFVML